jgi:hypothetical protein
MTTVKIPYHWVKGRCNAMTLSSFSGYTVVRMNIETDPASADHGFCVITLSETLDAGQKTALEAALIAELDKIVIT